MSRRSLSPWSETLWRFADGGIEEIADQLQFFVNAGAYDFNPASYHDNFGFGLRLFVAGAPMRYLVPIGGLGATIAVFGALVEPYRRARVLAFLELPHDADVMTRAAALNSTPINVVTPPERPAAASMTAAMTFSSGASPVAAAAVPSPAVAKA